MDTDIDVEVPAQSLDVPVQPAGMTRVEEAPAQPAQRRPQVVARLESPRLPSVERMMYSSSPEIGELVSALAKATMQFDEIEKVKEARITGRANYSYKYETLADVIAATRKGLSENGLVVMQFPFPGTATITLRTMVAHSSGQWITNDIVAALPNGDNAPQSVGGGITFLMRYARKAILGISAYDEDTDAGSASGDDDDRPRAAQRKSEAAPAPAAPAPAPAPEKRAGDGLVGRITAFDEPDLPGGRKGLRLMLDTGLRVGTSDAQLIEDVKKLAKVKNATVRLTVRQAADPAKLPTLLSIVPCRHDEQ